MSLIAQVVDVQKLLPELPISDTSKPSDVEVQEILDSIEAEIIAVMPDNVRTVALDDLSGLTEGGKRIFKQHAAIGAAIQVWAAAYSSSQLFDKIELWRTQYKDFLTRLERGGYNLIATQVERDDNALTFGRWTMQTPEVNENGL